MALAADFFNSLPSQGRVSWIRKAIAEKLPRDNRFVASSAEAKAIAHISKPISESDWVTVGTLDEEFDLDSDKRGD